MKDVSHYSSSQSTAQSIKKSPVDVKKDSVPEPEGFLSKAYWMLSEFIRNEIVCSYAIMFVMLFNQTSLETMIVPMFEDLLGWTEFETSLFFCGAGIVVDIVIWFISAIVGIHFV
ncbi:uncharacterized protein [Dysidea avara]|uniref:uncharacterized protein n=1 Tax=Dysidea avara TaxID=196820 RepID=UPI00331D3049